MMIAPRPGAGGGPGLRAGAGHRQPATSASSTTPSSSSRNRGAASAACPLPRRSPPSATRQAARIGRLARMDEPERSRRRAPVAPSRRRRGRWSGLPSRRGTRRRHRRPPASVEQEIEDVPYGGGFADQIWGGRSRRRVRPPDGDGAPPRSEIFPEPEPRSVGRRSGRRPESRRSTRSSWTSTRSSSSTWTATTSRRAWSSRRRTC